MDLSTLGEPDRTSWRMHRCFYNPPYIQVETMDNLLRKHSMRGWMHYFQTVAAPPAIKILSTPKRTKRTKEGSNSPSPIRGVFATGSALPIIKPRALRSIACTQPKVYSSCQS